MTVSEAADALKQRLSGKSALGSTLKFDLGGDGAIYVDGKSAENTVSQKNDAADCTISMSLEDLNALMKGELQPTAAFMQGKMKVDGDMGVAMRLSQFV
jgi:putative sterol carrier protein